MRVYIAGPLTKGDMEANVRRAIEASHEAMDLGLHPFVPHLSYYSNLARERGYEEWMTLDFAYLDVCEVLWRLPGESDGSDREVARARARGIPVVFSVVELQRWLVAQQARALEVLEARVRVLCGEVVALHAQRDDLQARNTELVEQRRAAEAAAEAARVRELTGPLLG